jgi:hypothetical protein
VFTYCYALLTAALDRHMAAERPEHPEYLVAVARRFADRYILALDTWDAGCRDEVSPGWRIVFERIAAWRTSPGHLALPPLAAGGARGLSSSPCRAAGDPWGRVASAEGGASSATPPARPAPQSGPSGCRCG